MHGIYLQCRIVFQTDWWNCCINSWKQTVKRKAQKKNKKFFLFFLFKSVCAALTTFFAWYVMCLEPSLRRLQTQNFNCLLLKVKRINACAKFIFVSFFFFFSFLLQASGNAWVFTNKKSMQLFTDFVLFFYKKQQASVKLQTKKHMQLLNNRNWTSVQ